MVLFNERLDNKPWFGVLPLRTRRLSLMDLRRWADAISAAFCSADGRPITSKEIDTANLGQKR